VSKLKAVLITAIVIGSLAGTVSGGAAQDQVGDAVVRVTDVEVLDERTRDLTIDSPSVGTQKVRLLLPVRFEDEPETRWPVLYLLHGAWDDYTSWTRETDVADLTADLDLLVVMPEASEGGWYSDWWNSGEGGPPMWETFHLTELREILEQDWRADDRRVIAGLSMGGFGAMSYAARHPELFSAAASFSGVLDPFGSDFREDLALWGDKIDQAEIWAAHDPVSLAPALEELPLLKDLGIPITVEAGSGTHSWLFWETALHRSLPMLLETIEE